MKKTENVINVNFTKLKKESKLYIKSLYLSLKSTTRHWNIENLRKVFQIRGSSEG